MKIKATDESKLNDNLVPVMPSGNINSSFDRTFLSCLVSNIRCTKCDVRRIYSSNCSLSFQGEQVLVLVLVKPFIVGPALVCGI